MRTCCVPGCNNRYTPNGIIAFHHLPQGLRNEERRLLWEKNIGRPLLPKSVVCERHFTSDQFEQNRKDGKRPLRWNAIPTIFSNKKITIAKRSRQLYATKQPVYKISTTPQFVGNNILTGMEETTIKLENPQQINLVQQVMMPLDAKQLNELKKETPPGCIPILPKYDPALYVSVKRSEIEEYKKDISKYKFLAETCTNKVNSLISMFKHTSKDKNKVGNKLKLVFNDDQIECLNGTNNEINWGYKTLEKAAELYNACGEEGYNVVIAQKLPYPNLELLKKLRPDVFMNKAQHS